MNAFFHQIISLKGSPLSTQHQRPRAVLIFRSSNHFISMLITISFSGNESILRRDALFCPARNVKKKGEGEFVWKRGAFLQGIILHPRAHAFNKVTVHRKPWQIKELLARECSCCSAMNNQGQLSRPLNYGIIHRRDTSKLAFPYRFTPHEQPVHDLKLRRMQINK